MTVALSAFASVASAQQLGGSDLGQTAPTPGANDISQLLTTGDTVALPDSGPINSFYDNTTDSAGSVGSSFTTGANASGYTMTSLALKFGGGQPVGYAGGADTTLDPGWTITLYQLSGTGNTNATGIYTNTVGTLAGTANTGGDWIQITGFSQKLLANTVYAWTILSSGYDDMGWATNKPYTGGAICQIPPAGGLVTYAPDNASATFDVGLAVGTPQLGGADLGSTAPTPGSSDVAQLLTTGDTTALNGPGPLNAFYDNTAIGTHSSTGYVGSSFTTGGNPGGYVMGSLALKFGGGQPVGYAGGADTTLDPGWIISIYQLSGTGNTNATGLYTNTVGQLAGKANTGGDWVKITGFSQKLLPSTVYAWTIFSSGYDDMAYATGTPYAGGAICEIPPGGGAVTYYPTVADSATFDVGLTPIVLPLGGVDLGSTAPTPGPADAAQLLTTGDTTALNGPGPLNAFYDNTAIGSHSSTGYVGSSFTTGSNPGGYTLSSLALKFGGGSPVGYAGGADTTLDPGWIISLYELSGTGATTATPIYTNTVGQLAGTVNTGADWVDLTGFYGISLLPNTVYAWTIFSTGYDDMAYATGTPYAGGAICEIPPGGGAVTYYPTVADSATFDVGLTLAGYPSAGAATASPNPCYALSPILLSDTASGPGTLTYQWQTNSDLSGALGGTWVNIPNATNLTLTITPPNTDVGTLDFQFIVSNAAGSATNGPIALVVNAAQAPASSTGVTPASVQTYVGATLSFSDTSFVGTTPITYQWQVNTGSGYANIPSTQNPSATNTTLNLTNVQLSGTYQLVATSSQGSANDSSIQVGTLTLLTPPALPTSTSPIQNVPYVELTNGPWAYWRLQETANPQSAPPAVVAYDYSGNGFFATYGNEMSDGATGPTPPVYPGFSSSEVAAQPYSALPNGYLTVPPLNLTSTNVTFLAWINPAAAQNASTGLFFNRNGSDAAGFGFNGTLNPNGNKMPCLGFTWDNNSSATWSWNSGLFPVVGDWSLVAYVVTPSNVTAYLYFVDTTVSPNTTNYFQSTKALANTLETFSTNTIYIGADTQQTSGRTFNGSIAEVALYQKALSANEVQQIFLTSINSKTAPATAPTALPTASVFGGESFTFDGTAGGTSPISYQWKCSTSSGGPFTNVPSNQNYSSPTNATLTISNATVTNALYYEVVASNSVAVSTSGQGSLAVTPIPTGLWTLNLQVTNDTLSFATSTSGGGSYSGPGVLGTGTYWNAFVNNAGAFASATFSTVTDLESDGVTDSGIYATVYGQDDSTLIVPAASGSLSTLLDQFLYIPTTLTFTGVPDGTYNLLILGVNGGF
ncbi:MAG: LamG-like jellyroll fold domain-containing protein, partial [Terracidiphilus sp.]